ncbi:hypothetical protein Tco_0283953, partial [Tanacetum coccineum]
MCPFSLLFLVVYCDALSLAGGLSGAVPLSSDRGVTVYISPPPYLASAGLGNNVVVVYNRNLCSLWQQMLLHCSVSQFGSYDNFWPIE